MPVLAQELRLKMFCVLPSTARSAEAEYAVVLWNAVLFSAMFGVTTSTQVRDLINITKCQ